MYLKLRVLFTILSALCVAATIPVGVALGFMGAVICAALAFMFYLVMLTFKLKHESLNPPTQADNEQSESLSSEEKSEN